jgi:hypothetical protein
VTISENGQRKRISKHEIILKQLLKQAMTGNAQALRTYLALYRLALERAGLLVGLQSDNSGRYDHPRSLTDEELERLIADSLLQEVKQKNADRNTYRIGMESAVVSPKMRGRKADFEKARRRNRCILPARSSAFFLDRLVGVLGLSICWATPSQAFGVAGDEWTTGLLILTGGFLYWVAPHLRLPLAVAGIFGGFYRAFYMSKSPNHLYYWNILHGDIFALGNWSEAILVVITVLCAVEF